MALRPSRATLRARFATEWPQIVRIVIAATVSWEVCKLIDTSAVPIFAVVAPLVAMRDEPFAALNVSFDRILGVVVGVILGIVVIDLIGLNLLSMIVVLAVGLLVGVVLRVGPALNIQISLTGLLVFTNADPSVYGITRLWETLIGAAVTVVLSPFLFPPDTIKRYRAEFVRVSRELGEQTSQAAVLVEDGSRNHEVLKRLLAEVRHTEGGANALPGTLQSARRAVRNNPLRRHRIGELDSLVEVTGTVDEVARSLRLLVEELVDLSGRRDTDRVWKTSGPWLSRVLRPVAAVLDATLVRGVGETAEEASVAEATGALRDWRQADPDPIAVVMRRPAFRLVRVVGTLTDEEIGHFPGDPGGRLHGTPSPPP